MLIDLKSYYLILPLILAIIALFKVFGLIKTPATAILIKLFMIILLIFVTNIVYSTIVINSNTLLTLDFSKTEVWKTLIISILVFIVCFYYVIGRRYFLAIVDFLFGKVLAAAFDLLKNLVTRFIGSKT